MSMTEISSSIYLGRKIYQMTLHPTIWTHLPVFSKQIHFRIEFERKCFRLTRNKNERGFHSRLLPVISRGNRKAAMGRRPLLQSQSKDVCGARPGPSAAD